ncbi:distal membrane-arm assembly complex protein 2 [Trichomycterus rosablanca]|uniref:distal membrane-arm assembly complex protein 2 n=1 Tax=Trichomycterus rosablanca TaxID=2290929 RepID=UPI002F358CF4
MAASILFQAKKCCTAISALAVARRQYSSSSSSYLNKLLIQLNKRFVEVEYVIRWSNWFRNRAVRSKNKFYDYTQKKFGANIASGYSVLKLGGGFRFAGQTEWFRADSKGNFSVDFVNTPNSTIEEIDLSHTLINRAGLDNLVSQKGLRSLSLQGCPEVDDWFLARLHVFGESLQELNISHCAGITVGGLVALQHLRHLQRLDMSSLPRLQNPGLVRILVEEMLPRCKVTGAEYDQGLLIQTNSQEQTETDLLSRAQT